MSAPEEPKIDAMDDAQLGKVTGGARLCYASVEEPQPEPVAEGHGPVVGCRPFPDKTVTNY